MTADTTIYILGYWSNPYRSGDREYFWMRCEDGKLEAKKMGSWKQKFGQPSRFTNWCQGQNKFFNSVDKFVAAANKVGMNPRLS